VRKFHGAVGRNDELCVTLAISRNPGLVDAPNNGGPAHHHNETPIFRAIRMDRVKMVELLVSNGVDLETPYKGLSPVHAAITASEGIFGNRCRPIGDGVTKALLARCDLTSVPQDGNGYAYLFGNGGGTIYHSLALAENCRCDWDYAEVFGIIAARKGRGDPVPDPNTPNAKDISPLVMALYINKPDSFVSLLVEHGASIFPSDFETECLSEVRKWSSAYGRLQRLQQKAQVHCASLVRNFGESPSEIYLGRLPDEIWREVVGYV